jgi:hypothetical protein
MPLQKRAIFVLKCQPLVMFLLPLYVSPHCSNVRLRYRESPITGLPTESYKFGSLSFDPPRGCPLYALDGAAQCHGATQFKKDVDMILHRIDTHGWGLQVPQHGHHVTMKRRPNLIIQKPLSALGCKYQMNCDLCQRMGHAYGIVTRGAVRCVLGVPRWGGCVWGGVGFPRRCRGLAEGCPVGADALGQKCRLQ